MGDNWSEPMGGCDADGNPVTVSFGSGKAEGHTLLGDGDRSEVNFLDSANHDHYGSGNGSNNNGTSRGQYTGRGSSYNRGKRPVRPKGSTAYQD